MDEHVRVLYDYQAFQMQKYGGVSNCFVQLIKHLPKDIVYQIAIRESKNIHLIESQLLGNSIIPQQEMNMITNYLNKRRRLFELYSRVFPQKTDLGRNKAYASELLEEGNYDVFHPTFFDDYFLKYIGNRPYVLTIHDMIPELFYKRKDDIQLNNKKKLVQNARHIIAVSEKTKCDIVTMMGVPETKISVIYHGVNSDSQYEKPKPIFDFNYFLYVGKRDGYKNFVPMVKALAPIILMNQININLVCTGPSFSKSERQLFQELQIQDRVIHIEPNDKEMKSLYAFAKCFIFPSLYEGFGIPILEAWKENCPVLLNSRSCFPEIAGNAAIYFDLNDNYSNLTDVMINFLEMDDDEREGLLKRQKERIKQYSWEKSAFKLAQIYRDVAYNH